MIKRLVNEIKFGAKVFNVKINKEVIKNVTIYFDFDKIPNREIFIYDAFKYLFKT